MGANHNARTVDTTLGEVIAAVSEAAFECSKDTREAYILAGFVLEEILRKSPTAKELHDFTMGEAFQRDGHLN